MKIFTATIIVLAICMIGFNVIKIDLEAPFQGDSSIALVGIFASLCAIVLMLILQTSRKIAEKMKE
ncbi:hypothetical protein SAMN05216480_10125 [Pustulibacterium marinum]|uniref:Uncharacterized protein n=1 Tax=Pustulibacterium marinum TaxID=1224947 RepID=A0A1I7ESV3_9FLAO|nr:hypothetical protein [Pustulibacterium marinum]SFU26983.1 hypothetical protein SAMN05216480_10125 [Pustulibacterium marinum]